VVSKDAWWPRQLVWVRIQHRSTGKVILFANTHGPLGCESRYGTTMINTLHARARHGDNIVMAGDFNCNPRQKSMQDMMRFLPHGVHTDGRWAYPDGGVDHIISRELQLIPNWGGPSDGFPSDHPFLKARFRLCSDCGSGPTPPSPSPVPPHPTPGGWSACRGRSKACCNPKASSEQRCPGTNAKCQSCGGASACECPEY
jgi:hypothetical protein